MDYNSGIADGSPEGYRVLKGTLTTSDNISAVLECCYRVGPLVDFEIPRINIPVANTDRSVKIGINIKSNFVKRVTGSLSIVVPDPLRVLNGGDRKIAIFTNRGQDRDGYEEGFDPLAQHLVAEHGGGGFLLQQGEELLELFPSHPLVLDIALHEQGIGFRFG